MIETMSPFITGAVIVVSAIGGALLTNMVVWWIKRYVDNDRN